MSALLSAADFQAALIREGCKVVALPGWDTHNRDAGHTPLTPNGVVIHHTGSDTTDPLGYARNILWSGYAGLPGPLCHAGGAPDGTIILVGHGRANHAGGGDPASLAAAVADTAPMDGELHPRFGNLNGVDGNSRFYGLEIIYSGGHPMTPQQHIASVKFATALSRAHGWSARSTIGHREWSSDKVDPGLCPMYLFRADVAAALALPAGQWPNTATPAPTPKDGFLMALSDTDQAELKTEVHSILARVSGPQDPSSLMGRLIATQIAAQKAAGDTAALTAAFTALATSITAATAAGHPVAVDLAAVTAAAKAGAAEAISTIDVTVHGSTPA